ncbi:ankyrin repeat-containing domain protein [Chaetomium tenue]|uniref:Ankyrin repeat-containing domain protein n=1 Tax=Chaetomium tenue TaxID=1854479 RepID=A0ACB7NU29_9PEZI|nr:ankyrin repeat-containing domain protein [Chaetomium globosum]
MATPPRRISPAEWDSHKDAISTAYLTKTLGEVITHIGDTYGFYATKAQYVRKLKQWGLEKNSTKEKWEFAASQVQKRRLEGKDTEVIINGRPVPAKKLKKEMARYASGESSVEKVSAAPADGSHAVTVQTPPAANIFGSIRCADIPWFQFQDLLDSPSFWTGITSVDEACNPTTTGGFYFLPTPWQDDGALVIGLISEELSHEREPLSFEQPAPLSKSRTANREAKELLGECLGVKIDPDSPEYVLRISSHLDNIGVQKRSGEFVQRVDTLSAGGASAVDMCFHLLRYVVYLGSNNMLYDSEVDKLLQWAIRSERLSAVERLIAPKTPSVEVFAVKLLAGAARLDEVGVARTLINWGVDVNGFAGTETTALQEAVKNRNAALISLLLDAGANPNIYFKNGGGREAPLWTAIIGRSRCLEIAKMLIGHGADVNIRSSERSRRSFTLLSEAILGGNTDAVQMLLGAGARVNETRAIPALHVAASCDNLEVAQVLLDAGADVDSPAGKAYAPKRRKAVMEGRHRVLRTPLQWAVSRNNVEMCQVILEAGADVNGFPAADYLRRVNLFGRKEGRRWDDAVIYDEEGGDNGDDGDGDSEEGSNNANGGNGDDGEGSDNGNGGDGDGDDDDSDSDYSTNDIDNLGDDDDDIDCMSTVLQAAAGSGNEETVKLLLSQGALVNAAPSRWGGRTALQAAAESGKSSLVRLLVDAGADVNAPAAPEEGRTCLQTAAEQGDLEMVNYLLRSGADVNGPASARSGRTALQAAVEWDRVAVVEQLLEAGADVRACPSCEDGLQPLCAALSNRSYELARLLLDKGADPNENYRASSPLGIAASHGEVEMVRCLILAGADVNSRSDVGVSALETAASQGNAEVVNLLIDGGATLDGIDGTRALERAVVCSFLDLVKLFLAKGVSPNRPSTAYVTGQSALQRAITTRRPINYDIIRLLLDYGADVKVDGGSCLQAAARAGYHDIVQMLVAAGGDANFPRPEGNLEYTALQEAISSKDIDMVHALLDAGADVNGTPVEVMGQTALQAAILSEDIDIVHALLDAGADVNAPPSGMEGETALQLAVSLRDKDMIQLLLSRGADVNGPPSKLYGETALQRAVTNGRLSITLILLQAGADVNAPAAAEKGRTALEAAAENGRLDLACLLLQNEDDPDVEAVRMRCESAAEIASSSGHTVLARMLRDWKTSAAEI